MLKNNQKNISTGQTRPWIKWYKTTTWKKIRERQLAIEPLCRFCKKDGVLTPATVVDHIIPHKEDMKLFFEGPFQSLCKRHHDSTKQKIEKSGEFGCDKNGIVPAWRK